MENTDLLCDWQIREQIRIDPIAENEKRQGKISYGLSSYGYDARLAPEFKILRLDPSGKKSLIIDPKNAAGEFEDYNGNECVIPPNHYVLGRTIEHFTIPRNVIGICVGKSTYARCGIIANVTPLEPEWSGHITIEISNASSLPAKVYANEGIIQILFFRSGVACMKTYADKSGIYQNQSGITTARVRNSNDSKK